ncbi:hypothetical protein PPERSA_00100 [Pseudocohnilembus persalinus]|uniref:Uncharacterized protein n=1 Tax=Pseudocohnilembus persalinus TaxID=266149 RepID=A0A0V0Q907_PSEPJ|nr:hypothetical protein PPERSA_00100 [Pseudocohnilembus persalinus]|eukprot:KRW98503.1 hypothetical protein PPERSA_00100 [Pseudocohnilembus persalinus]
MSNSKDSNKDNSDNQNQAEQDLNYSSNFNQMGINDLNSRLQQLQDNIQTNKNYILNQQVDYDINKQLENQNHFQSNKNQNNICSPLKLKHQKSNKNQFNFEESEDIGSEKSNENLVTFNFAQPNNNQQFQKQKQQKAQIKLVNNSQIQILNQDKLKSDSKNAYNKIHQTYQPNTNTNKSTYNQNKSNNIRKLELQNLINLASNQTSRQQNSQKDVSPQNFYSARDFDIFGGSLQASSSQINLISQKELDNLNQLQLKKQDIKSAGSGISQQGKRKERKIKINNNLFSKLNNNKDNNLKIENINNDNFSSYKHLDNLQPEINNSICQYNKPILQKVQSTQVSRQNKRVSHIVIIAQVQIKSEISIIYNK